MESREASLADAPAAGTVLSDEAIPAEADPVIAALETTHEQYQQMRSSWEGKVLDLEEGNQKLTEQVDQLRAQQVREKQRAERHKQRARMMAEEIKNIHRALFDGNLFNLILRSCMTITNATRGLYVTVGAPDRFWIRAAIDFDGRQQGTPSEFVQALCRKVVTDNESFVADGPGRFEDLPVHPGPDEHFQNLLAAPAVLLGGLHGVVLLADKLDGGFDHEDVDTVLSVGDQASVAVANHRLQAELQSAYLSIVGVLADAVEAKDPYTHGHCELVARYARLTARRLGLSDEECGIVCYGGLLHDVGKIGISDGVLNKPGKLLPEEWTLMRSHVRIGRDLLSNVPLLQRVAEVVLHHHEAYDGSGYPQGLKGDEIPLAARIVSVSDSYCAMISKRSYKESFSKDRARNELVRCRGKQFDPAVVDAFLAVLDSTESEQDEWDSCQMPHGLNPSEDLQFVFNALRAHQAHGAPGRQEMPGRQAAATRS